MAGETSLLDALTDRVLRALVDDTAGAAELRFILGHYAASGRDDLSAALEIALARAVGRAATESLDSRELADWIALFIEASSLSDDVRVKTSAAFLAERIRGEWRAESAGVAASMRAVEACLIAADNEERGVRMAGDAIDALELLAQRYDPGRGMSDESASGLERLSGDVQSASTLLTAYMQTGRLPYSMLAEELIELVMRSDWPGTASASESVVRFDDQTFVWACRTASVLSRLAKLHANREYLDSAVVKPGADYRHEASLLLAMLAAGIEERPVRSSAEYGLAVLDWLRME